MTLIVEDGTGLANANSYASREAADEYHSVRGNAAWLALSVAAREAALIRATDYIDANYVFRSVKLTDTQALENPRWCQDALAANVVKATIDLALLTATTSALTATAKPITEETKILEGVGETTTKYEATKISTDPFPPITKLLKNVASRHGASASSTRLRQ